MCVILERNPGVIIPADKLERACDINKHGFGITYSLNGKLQFIRSLVQPNNPKTVADHLQKLKAHKVWVHLRHATVGAVNKDNNHPFLLLGKKRHGYDLAMMHNGTLFSYKPTDQKSTDSDTLIFAKEFAAPLALRFHAFNKHKLLEDEFFKKFLKQEVGYSSVVVLVDGAGNTLCINRDKGKEYEGWWASNDYSFQDTHHRSSSRPPTSHHHGWDEGYGDIDGGMAWWEREDREREREALPAPWKEFLTDDTPEIASLEVRPTQRSATPTNNTPDTFKVRWECQKVGELIEAKQFQHGASVMSGGAMMIDLKKIRSTFLSMSGLKDLKEVGKLSETDLMEMAKDYPYATARLVFDLLGEISTLEIRNETQRKIIRGDKEKEDGTAVSA